jgi:hypothetical protein
MGNPLMCRHPFPFEILAYDKDDHQHVSHSRDVLNVAWHNGGAARPSLAGVKSDALAPHLLPKRLVRLLMGCLKRL